MEYEIEDEHALFDDSTNPSLHDRDKLDPKRKPQKAELIPEEEEEQQLA